MSDEKSKKIAVGGFVGLALVLLVLGAMQPVSAAWTKIAPIHVNNIGGNAQAYYQVRLFVSYDSDMNSNFSDLRVVENETYNFIPYWIENKSDGEWCVLWFNATYIPANSWCNDTYYLLYGNASASDASDGDATFLFFDDFEDGTTIGGFIQDTSFSEDGTYLQGVASDGTYLYHTHTGSWDGKAGKLVKCYKNGTVVATKEGLYGEDGPLTGAVSSLCYHDGYLYLVGFGENPNDGSQNKPIANQEVAKYDPSDLSYVEKYSIDFGDGGAEGIAFYDNYWWITSHHDSIIRKYNTNWEFVKEYDIEGHGDDEGQLNNGNGYQDITFWEEPDGRVFAGLTVHSSCDHGPALYIFQYDKDNDLFTLYKTHTSGDIVPDQGWCCDNELDPSETWWAVRHSAKIAKSLTLSNLVNQGDLWEFDSNYASTDYAHSGSYCMKLPVSGDPSGLSQSMGSLSLDNYSYIWWVYLTATSGRCLTTSLRDSENHAGVYLKFEDGNIYYAHPTYTDTGEDFTVGWHRIEVIQHNTTFDLKINDGVWHKGFENQYPDTPLSDVDKFAIKSTADTGQTYIYSDDYAVRKYTDPEPSAILGEEQNIGTGCTSPTISSLTNSTPGTTSVTITWTTDQSADNRVKYSKNSDLSNPLWSSWANDTSSVSITLTGLDPDTTYYYQAWSYNGTNSSCYTTEPSSQPYRSFTTDYVGGKIFGVVAVEPQERYSDNPILQKGSAGSWDEYGIRDNALLTDPYGNPIIENGHYVLYYSGMNNDYGVAVGRATFERPNVYTIANMTKESSNPVIKPSDFGWNDSTGRIGMGCVIKKGEGDYIAYLWGKGEAPWDYALYYATSSDGISWTVNTTPILTPGDFADGKALTLPNVKKIQYGSNAGLWVMYIEHGAEDLCYATSSDGLNWTAENNGNPIITASNISWASAGRGPCNPKFLEVGENKYILGMNADTGSPLWKGGFMKSTNLDSGWEDYGKVVLDVGLSGEWDDTRVESLELFKSDFGGNYVGMLYFGLPTIYPWQDGAIGYTTINQNNQSSYTITLEQGYNMIGWTSTTPTTSSELCSEVPYCEYVYLKNPDASWTSKRCGFPGGDFSISRGFGCLVKVSQTADWTRDE